ncbi:MAG TPA: quinate 5-dehydrogenase [Clostridia bacterium]|nr:quinate 5-dehydrogenase [Clostridia bacterium]
MKKVVSVSIGSSKRDHYVETEIMGEKFTIERIGTDGSIKKAIELIEKIDGKVDAIGMGGISLHLWAGDRPYTIRAALPIKNAAKVTPVVDGSGLKNTLEKRVIEYLHNNDIIDFAGKKVLVTSGLDRFGMAESLEHCGADMVLGDLMFALGIKIPIYSLKGLRRVAAVAAPIACRLPFHVLYPTGKEQNENIDDKFAKYYDNAEVIAGDFHYIKRFMPIDMKGKAIITNTVTEEDVNQLKARGVGLFVTTTPEFNGRSFGTNVMEGVVIALLKANKKEGTLDEYEEILNILNLKPRIEYLNKIGKAI